MDLEKSLDTFRVLCPFTNINVQEDFINYEVGYTSRRDLFAINLANKIIKENELPLKAEMVGFPFRHILKITQK